MKTKETRNQALDFNLNREREGKEMNVEIVKLSASLDIHKIHHRNKFPEYLEEFECETDTLFFNRARAVLVTKRLGGRVIFSGQWREGTFSPLVAYCDIQGVTRDLFIIDNEGLSGVEREHRDSLVNGTVRDENLPYVVNFLKSYLGDKLPLASGEAIKVVENTLEKRYVSRRHNHVNGEVNLLDLRQYYAIFKVSTPQVGTLENALANVERDTRNARLRALLPLTKANQRLAHYNNLNRGYPTTSANQKIERWEDDGKITFSSGITETIDKDKAREFLEGKITSLRTSFGQITFDSQIVTCGCHRVTVKSAREWLGLPSIEAKEESFPDFLQSITDKVKEIESHRSQELEPFELAASVANEAFQAFRDEQDNEEGKLAAISYAYSEHVKEGGKWEEERKEYYKFHAALQDADRALRDFRSEINSARHEMRSELEDRLTKANNKARETVLAKLEGSGGLMEAIAKNTVAITADHEKKALEAKQVIDSQAALESLRAWLDYVALTSSQALIQTTNA